MNIEHQSGSFISILLPPPRRSVLLVNMSTLAQYLAELAAGLASPGCHRRASASPSAAMPVGSGLSSHGPSLPSMCCSHSPSPCAGCAVHQHASELKIPVFHLQHRSLQRCCRPARGIHCRPAKDETEAEDRAVQVSVRPGKVEAVEVTLLMPRLEQQLPLAGQSPQPGQ